MYVQSAFYSLSVLLEQQSWKPENIYLRYLLFLQFMWDQHNFINFLRPQFSVYFMKCQKYCSLIWICFLKKFLFPYFKKQKKKDIKPQAVYNTNPNSKLYFGDWFNSFIPFFLFCENSYHFGHQERRGGYLLDRQDQIRCCSLKGFFCRPYEFLGGGQVFVMFTEFKCTLQLCFPPDRKLSCSFWASPICAIHQKATVLIA